MTPHEQEAWLVRRLREHGATISGAATFAEASSSVRIDLIRCAILDAGLAEVIAGRHDGKPETYASVFERVYGEPLAGNKRQRVQASAQKPTTKETRP